MDVRLRFNTDVRRKILHSTAEPCSRRQTRHANPKIAFSNVAFKHTACKEDIENFKYHKICFLKKITL
ncbi:Non-reducing polyketide synthase PKS12 [Trichinella pseudospiralis]